LPIEFARISSDKRLTLVIHSGSPEQRTYWALSEFGDLKAARANLQARESTASKHIHSLVADDQKKEAVNPEISARIREWLKAHLNLEAAIWTGLPSNWEREQQGRKFKAEDAVQYLSELERACDEEVLQAGSQAEVYAETILKVCEFYLESPLTCMSGITGSNLKKRMERIMRNHVGERLKIRKKLLLTTAVMVALALPVVVGVMTAPRLSAQSSPATANRALSDVASVTLNTPESPLTSEPQSQVYQAGKDGVSFATCAYCPNPKYSDQAIKAHYEGAVTLQAVITAEGRATKIKVVKSPGLGLDKEAVDVVKLRWRFNPAKGPDGKPVAVDVPIEVTFRLPTKKDSN
jgi:TonB family protein